MMSWFYQFWLRVLTPIGRLLFWVNYKGTKNIPKHGKLIVCSNHKSVFDPFLLAIPFRRQIQYMAKTELFTDHGILARAVLLALGAFPVKRNTGDISALRRAEKILDGEGIVGIFPQGGCVFDNAPFRPKPGVALMASRTGAPVLPVSIYCKGLLRPFKRITIRFGKAIFRSELFSEGNSGRKLRASADLIAVQINTMLEEGH
jgi:1-acyl-sn-glycerol-3-phosphate acyltransferase